MAKRKNTTAASTEPSTHQMTYEEAGEILAGCPRGDLLLLLYNSLRIAFERDSEPEFATANRNALVTAAVGCTLLLERGPELVAHA